MVNMIDFFSLFSVSTDWTTCFQYIDLDIDVESVGFSSLSLTL